MDFLGPFMDEKLLIVVDAKWLSTNQEAESSSCHMKIRSSLNSDIIQLEDGVLELQYSLFLKVY